MSLTISEVQVIAKKYVDLWATTPERKPLWVVLANPGDSIQVPGISFHNYGNPVAGLHIQLSSELIVLNQQMVPESILSTFFHELGHAIYKSEQSESWNEVDSEVSAVITSLSLLLQEGFPELAVREAKAFSDMSIAEPYASALPKVSIHPVWQSVLSLTSIESSNNGPIPA